ncbi:hypothetical protein HYE37_02370 [Mycoplasmopsis bovis]|nr:hypothetical protein [Mycoplasmopsis bovis]QQH21333.1 hypothetical protein HYE37_02370 [Mycoplasmopsis bovis]
MITPQTIDNQKQQEDKSKEEKPNGSGNSSQILLHKLKIIKTQEDNIKEKEQMIPSVLVNSFKYTQIQDNQNHSRR